MALEYRYDNFKQSVQTTMGNTDQRISDLRKAIFKNRGAVTDEIVFLNETSLITATRLSDAYVNFNVVFNGANTRRSDQAKRETYERGTLA